MAVIMLIEGIVAKLRIQPSDAAAYGIEISIDHHPTLGLALRLWLLADDRRLEVDTLSSSLQLGPEQDHYLTPPMQKLLTELDINGPRSVRRRGCLPSMTPTRRTCRQTTSSAMPAATWVTTGWRWIMSTPRSPWPGAS